MYTTEYQYIQASQKSQIFLAHYLPAGHKARPDKAKAIILVPPFAEEMNRSKRMYVLCARLLANAGLHVICFDYSGTGDSSGEWGEFSYQDWVNDLKTVYDYALKTTSDVDFIALRFGALLLTDAILGKFVSANKCIFWDPLESGEVLTRQLVRIKIAAAMADNSKKITSQEVMQSMYDIGHLESGGYHITQSMFDEISTKKLADNISKLLTVASVHWMASGKFKAGENKWLANSFKSDDLDSDLAKRSLSMHPVNDVKFWMQQEVTISPKLLQLTKQVCINE